ncbi:MAG: hypothetical protein U0792_24315 [Gemmataceae bacterium]
MTTRYTASVNATVVQLIHCVHCNSLSVYEMTLTGSAERKTGWFTNDATARNQASIEAQKDLEARFANEEALFNTIPCRKCYRYQPYMLQQVATQKYDTMGCFGYLLIGLGFLAAVAAAIALIFFSNNLSTVGFLVGLALIAWVVAGIVLVRMFGLIAEYDPNSDAYEERAKLANEKAASLDEYDERQAIQLRYHYNNYLAATRAVRLAHGDTFAGIQPLIVDWRVVPAILVAGGTFEINLSPTELATVQVPASTSPGTLLPLSTRTETIVPFIVRVVTFAVSPGERHRT